MRKRVVIRGAELDNLRMGVDRIIEWFVRAAVLAFNRLLSRHWIEKGASVTIAVWRETGFGCYVAMIQYQYSVDGNEFTGSHNEPFWTMGQGRGSVRSLPPGTAVHILYDPEDPTRSVFIDKWWQKL